MNITELIGHLQAMPPDATPVDEDDLEVIAVVASDDLATVRIWTEQK